jgi:hypothetical protein
MKPYSRLEVGFALSRIAAVWQDMPRLGCSKKGLKMGNETATDRAYLNQRFEELFKRFDETDKRIADIENKLTSGAGIGESASPDWEMFSGPMMPGMMPGGMPGMMPGGMPGMMPGMMPMVGPWTIWWAWWLSWFVWPFALPLAASGMFPQTSRFAAARAQFWSRWLEAIARMTQQTASQSVGRAPTKPGDPEVMKKLMAALNQGSLQSLSQEAKSQIIWAVRWAQMF